MSQRAVERYPVLSTWPHPGRLMSLRTAGVVAPADETVTPGQCRARPSRPTRPHATARRPPRTDMSQRAVERYPVLSTWPDTGRLMSLRAAGVVAPSDVTVTPGLVAGESTAPNVATSLATPPDTAAARHRQSRFSCVRRTSYRPPPTAHRHESTRGRAVPRAQHMAEHRTTHVAARVRVLTSKVFRQPAGTRREPLPG